MFHSLHGIEINITIFIILFTCIICISGDIYRVRLTYTKHDYINAVYLNVSIYTYLEKHCVNGCKSVAKSLFENKTHTTRGLEFKHMIFI